MKKIKLKGQFHEKVGEIRVWGVGVGHYYGLFFNFSDHPFDSYEFSKFSNFS
jgi:hypothetical protein